MRQLPLALHQVEPPSLENFVAGRNTECVALLSRLRAGVREPRFIYLWGPAGAGRSHLLAALAPPGHLVRAGATAAATIGAEPAAAAAIAALAGDAAGELYLIDDCDALDAPGQQALFTLYNRVQASQAPVTLVTTGLQPPLFTEVREDLRSRLGWGLVLRLQLLSDEDKARALTTHASRRGVELAADIVPWLLNHQNRDIRHLIALLDAFDRHAFEQKRALTLPLLREFLALAQTPDDVAAAAATPPQ